MKKKHNSKELSFIIISLDAIFFKSGGADQIRTGDQGVADPRLSHLATAPYHLQ